MAEVRQDITISVRGVNELRDASAAMKDVRDSAVGLGRVNASGVETAAASTERLAKAARASTNEMTSQRYQLYDVAAGYQMLANTLTGVAGAVVKLGMDYEASFQQVIRTTGLAGKEIEQVKGQLLDMSTKVPESFQNLSGIAAFGGQLGIAKNEIAEFTKTTAQLKATTDLTLDSAGQTLAMFQTTLGVAGKDFDNVASSILKVGVNSAATETQIANVSTQIGSMAQLAGYSADQVVGLAGAMASVRIPPELSRSIITQVFGKLQKSVQEGGASLETFAKVSGHSAEEVRQAWGTNKFAGIFTDFLAGLKQSGQGATQILQDIGIKSQRTVPALLRMAQASDLVKQTMADAKSGFDDTSTLTDQYGQIAQTTSAKMEMLKNSVANLGAAFGQSTNSGIGTFATMLTTVFNGIASLMKTGIGQWIAKIAAYATAAGIAWSLWHAKTALMLASSRALAQAFSSQSASGTQLSFTLRGVMRQIRELRAETMAAQKAHLQAAAAARQQAAANNQLAGSARGAGAAQAASTAAGGAGAGATALSRLATGLKGGAVMAGVTLGVEGLNMVLGHFAEKAEKARAAAEAWTQSGADLAAAIKQDTDAFNKTGEAVALYARAQDEAGNVGVSHIANLKDGADKSQLMAEAQGQLKNSVDQTTGSINTQVLALGENATKQIANMVASRQALGGVSDDARKLLAEVGFSTEELTKRIMQGPRQFDEYVNQIIHKLHELANAQRESGNWDGYLQAANAIEKLKEVQEHIRGSMSEATNKADDTAAAMRGLGQDTAATSDEMEGLGESTDKAVEQLNKLVDASFDGMMSQADLADAVANLGESIAKNGDNWDVYTEGGRANMKALEQAVHAAAEASGGDAQVFATYVDSIQQQLVQNGVGSLDILNQVAQRAMATVNQVSQGVNILASITQTAIFAGQALGLIEKANVVTPQLAIANTNLGRSYRQGVARGAEKAHKSMRKANKTKREAKKAAKEAAKEVKTLSDYYSDLSSTANNAFGFRHDLEESIDKAKDSLSKLADYQKKARDEYDNAVKSTRDAAKSVEDYRVKLEELHAQLAQLKADEGKLQFHLKIATDYGDSLRAKDIQAKLQQNYADQARNGVDRQAAVEGIADARSQGAAASKQMATAQEALSRSLNGATAASREQRSAIRDLAKAYQDQILAYANTGASQAQVKAYAAQLSNEFRNQTAAMGYNRSEIGRYAETFTDLQKIISRVPKKITISADTDPANRALNELSAKAQKTSHDVSNVGSGSTATPNVGGTTGALGKVGGAAKGAGGQFDWLQQMIAKFEPVVSAIVSAFHLHTAASMDGVVGSTKHASGGFQVMGSSIVDTMSLVNQYLAESGRTTGNVIDGIVNNIYSGINRINRAQSTLSSIGSTLAALGAFRFSTGGLVPGAPGQLAFKPMGTDTVPAMLTPGEFVLRRDVVASLPPGFLEALNSGAMAPGSGASSAPVSSAAFGGNGPVIVELSPYDRALLASGGNVTLNLDGRAIASSVAGANSTDTRRGF